MDKPRQQTTRFNLGGDRTPVLDVLRRSWDQGGRIVEAHHIVAGGDRNVLVYDGLALDPQRF